MRCSLCESRSFYSYLDKPIKVATSFACATASSFLARRVYDTVFPVIQICAPAWPLLELASLSIAAIASGYCAIQAVGFLWKKPQLVAVVIDNERFSTPKVARTPDVSVSDASNPDIEKEKSTVAK